MYENDQVIRDLEMDKQRSPLYKHVTKTYAWMFLGLLLTFCIAYSMIATGAVFYMFAVPWLPFVLLIAKLGLVVYLTSRLHKFSVTTARLIFITYAVLAGVVFAPILWVYDYGSAILIFGLAALFFGLMAGAGLITKRDVSGFAPIVSVGLIALIAMTLVSMFFQMEAFDTAICFIGLVLFMGITTYDSKKTKDLYYRFENDTEMLEKVSIYSALNLYLDFINIFLYLLRLLGKRK